MPIDIEVDHAETSPSKAVYDLILDYVGGGDH